MRHIRLLLIGLLVLGVDQASKAAALTLLRQGASVPVLPGFDLTLWFNTGASFGMLSGLMGDMPLAMASLTGLITAWLVVMAVRARHPLEAAGFAVIVGGSLGNILDRLLQGAVTDFLDLSWRGWHWPTFNMADVAITIGAVLILISALPAFRRKDAHV